MKLFYSAEAVTALYAAANYISQGDKCSEDEIFGVLKNYLKATYDSRVFMNDYWESDTDTIQTIKPGLDDKSE